MLEQHCLKSSENSLNCCQENDRWCLKTSEHVCNVVLCVYNSDKNVVGNRYWDDIHLKQVHFSAATCCADCRRRKVRLKQLQNTSLHAIKVIRSLGYGINYKHLLTIQTWHCVTNSVYRKNTRKYISRTFYKYLLHLKVPSLICWIFLVLYLIKQ